MLFLLILVLLVLFYVFFSNSGAKSQRNEPAFKIFESTPPILNIRFGYPPSWKLSVSRARDVEEETVQLMGPRDPQLQFSASFFIIAKKQDLLWSLDKELGAIIERKKQASQFRIISKKNIEVNGEDAREVIFDFVLGLPFDATKPHITTMREQIIEVAHSGLVYQIHFIGTLEQHRENNRLFQDFLKSFRFKN